MDKCHASASRRTADRSRVANILTTLLAMLVLVPSSLAQTSQPLNAIRRIDIVHMTHTDIGFTDHPLVCRRQQMRYLDIAIDAVIATRDAASEAQFYWTAETTLAVDDWWRAASEGRRQAFLDAVATGRLEVAALAMNQTPTLDAGQWQTTLHWLPDGLWDKVHPRVAIQNDVNGLPRAGAVALLDRGVDMLPMGINSTNGGPPMQRPSAFWWRVPDGRKMFVWLGDHYVSGFYYLYPESWRRGPVPESTDTRYRPPRAGEIFCSDDASVRAAHQHLLGKLAALEQSGYDYPSLVVSVTNEWRVDNDPPFPPIADFVATWQRLGLKPSLHMSTVADALDRLRAEVGDDIPVYEGEWTDWWANGCASGPREVAASRRAKRLLSAALSPVWGPVDESAKLAAEEIRRDLCLFDEHTWGASDSIGQPHTLDTWAQYNEKSRAAYEPMSLAKMLLARRARTAVYPEEAGVYVANTASLPWSGWIEMPTSCLRGDFHSLLDPSTGRSISITYQHGYRPHSRPASADEFTWEAGSETFPDHGPRQVARFWVEELAGNSLRRYTLSDEAIEGDQDAEVKPTIACDEQGWPESAIWPGMQQPLFAPGTGDFLSVAVSGFAGRWAYADIHHIADSTEREKRRAETLREELAVPVDHATRRANAHTTVFEQRLAHSRLKWLTRRLELWNSEPRARLTVGFHRTGSELPEIFFVSNVVPCAQTLPTVSCGGLPFVPFEDQLPGTCREYFAIDSWAQYATPAGNWLWASRDAPLVTLGDHQVLSGIKSAPENPGRVLSMVFNNVWFTNFVADSHGAMEFQFDFAWQAPGSKVADPATHAAALLSEPQVVINPALPEHPIFLERLHK